MGDDDGMVSLSTVEFVLLSPLLTVLLHLSKKIGTLSAQTSGPTIFSEIEDVLSTVGNRAACDMQISYRQVQLCSDMSCQCRQLWFISTALDTMVAYPCQLRSLPCP